MSELDIILNEIEVSWEEDDGPGGEDVRALLKALRLALYYVEGDATWEGLCQEIKSILLKEQGE